MTNKIITSDEYDKMTSAENLLKDASRSAEQIRKSAKHVFVEAKQKGYNEGLEMAKDEQADILINLVSGSIDYLAELETELINTCINTIDHFLCTKDDRELITGSVALALKHQQHSKIITLRACPEVINFLETDLKDIDSGKLNIVFQTDDRIPKFDCVLESDFSIVTINSKKQIENLKTLIQSKFDLSGSPHNK
ncbi:MAG: hypothetical protein ACWA44_15560 [Thiotrichales bacterium]